MTRGFIHHFHQAQVPGGGLAFVVVTNQQLLQLTKWRQLQPVAMKQAVQTQLSGAGSQQRTNPCVIKARCINSTATFKLYHTHEPATCYEASAALRVHSHQSGVT